MICSNRWQVVQGAGIKQGVIVQSYWAGHPAIASVALHRRELFDSELDLRALRLIPCPLIATFPMCCFGTQESQVKRCTAEVAEAIVLPQALMMQITWEVLGPAECIKARVKDRFRRHIYLTSL